MDIYLICQVYENYIRPWRIVETLCGPFEGAGDAGTPVRRPPRHLARPELRGLRRAAPPGSRARRPFAPRRSRDRAWRDRVGGDADADSAREDRTRRAP